MSQGKSDTESKAPKTRDYFAELYVAGMMGDHGWAIYLPKRDVGFDFVASKKVGDEIILRPIQVRGKYPTAEKKDRPVYPWIGKLSQVHPEMAVVLCFFSTDHSTRAPEHIAFVPYLSLKPASNHRWRYSPVSYKNGSVIPRPSYEFLFGVRGLDAMESTLWARSGLPSDDLS